jgi:hypothetical protein
MNAMFTASFRERICTVPIPVIITAQVLILLSAAASSAFALTFGMGGREFAGRMLKKAEDSFEDGPRSEAP